jgi:hypothetical protein
MHIEVPHAHPQPVTGSASGKTKGKVIRLLPIETNPGEGVVVAPYIRLEQPQRTGRTQPGVLSGCCRARELGVHVRRGTSASRYDDRVSGHVYSWEDNAHGLSGRYYTPSFPENKNFICSEGALVVTTKWTSAEPRPCSTRERTDASSCSGWLPSPAPGQRSKTARIPSMSHARRNRWGRRRGRIRSSSRPDGSDPR